MKLNLSQIPREELEEFTKQLYKTLQLTQEMYLKLEKEHIKLIEESGMLQKVVDNLFPDDYKN